MGMGGGMLLPQLTPRETIRREGNRLGYEGDAHDDFTEIIARIDDFFVEVAVRKAAAEAKAAADKARRNQRR